MLSPPILAHPPRTVTPSPSLPAGVDLPPKSYFQATDPPSQPQAPKRPLHLQVVEGACSRHIKSPPSPLQVNITSSFLTRCVPLPWCPSIPRPECSSLSDSAAQIASSDLCTSSYSFLKAISFKFVVSIQYSSLVPSTRDYQYVAPLESPDMALASVTDTSSSIHLRSCFALSLTPPCVFSYPPPCSSFLPSHRAMLKSYGPASGQFDFPSTVPVYSLHMLSSRYRSNLCNILLLFLACLSR